MIQTLKNSMSPQTMALFGVDPNVVLVDEEGSGAILFRHALIPMFTSPGTRPLPVAIAPAAPDGPVLHRVEYGRRR